MSESGQAFREVDLDNCAREPIHIPGSIQPHGFLLALHEPELAVRHASQNCGKYLDFDADALIGRGLRDFLPQSAVDALQGALVASRPQDVNPIKLRLSKAGRPMAFDAIAHRSQDLLLLEFEPVLEEGETSFSTIYRRINAAIEEIEEADNLSTLYRTTAERVKELSGYRRVMIYAFDADWNGKVVAEARDADQEPFLGLQYPASDIPAQARALYRRNWLRMIPDVGYEPSAILPPLSSGDEPLDLSQCALRSVSPMHVQYLKNMGVGASMSVSVIREGQLWGLIALHHDRASYLPYEVRQGLEFIGKVFSIQLTAKEKLENIDYKRHLKSLQPTLLMQMRQESAFLDGLCRHQPNFVELAAGCSGGAILHRGELRLIGACPQPEQIRQLAYWLHERDSESSVYVTDSLPSEYAQAADYKECASGLMAVTIPEPEPAQVMWFKPEVMQTVNWGGDPRKPVEFSQDGAKLSPRRSFALWRETVQMTSLPWAQEEIEAGQELRRSIIEVDLERQIRATMDSNAELEQYASVIAHDLKEPLRGIGFFADFLKEDLGDQVSSEVRANLAEIRQLTKKTQSLISELYEYSRVGQVELSFTDVNLQSVLEDVGARLKGRFTEAGAELVVHGPLPTVRCDHVRIAEVFANLLSNAVKYNDSPDKRVEVGLRHKTKADHAGGAPIIYVRDNGIGIAPEARERIFKVFQRLHQADAYSGGSGVGLAIVKRIIDRHGGRIWVESEPGHGATFLFTLQPSGHSGS
ncbi:GAF domain-containing protein [Proteobacteria bacterium 005FR1]|nr:GAF domain-containing protein [Proteobacteria bacterium 005FR1]